MNLDFKKLMSARFLLTMGMQIQGVVLGWQMYVLTRNPLYLGLIGLSEAIPAIGLALHAGLIVDRSRPLLVFRGVIFTSFLSGLAMLIWHDQVWGLFVASILAGTARAFTQPTMFAIMPRVVGRENLQKASAAMAMTLQIARSAGPGLGGIIFGFIGMQNTSLVICVLMASSIFFLFGFPFIPVNPTDREPVGQALLKGVRYVWGHPILFPALTMDMVSVMFGGVTALLPIYAVEILRVGPIGLGFLRGAASLGAACASFVMTRVDVSRIAGKLMMMGIGGWGVCILVFALSENFVLSLIALAASGALDSVSMVIRISAIQLASPDSMRGRISSVNSMFVSSSNELGEFESGVAAKLLGTVPAAIFGGVVCIGMVVFSLIYWPQLFRLDLNQLKAAKEVGT